MRPPLRVGLWLTLGLLAAALAVAFGLLLDSQPAVPAGQGAHTADRTWARDWLAARRFQGKRPGDLIRLRLSEGEANLVANEVLNQVADGQVMVRLASGRARILATLTLPWENDRRFLNLALTIVEEGQRPKLAAAKLAGIPLPAGLLNAALNGVLGRIEQVEPLRDFEIAPDRLEIAYEWRPERLSQMASGLLASDELSLAQHYQARLATRLSSVAPRQAVTLAELIGHLMGETDPPLDNADPIAANRAVIMALTALVKQQSLAVPGDPNASASLPHRRVILRGRTDLSQHFMVSAVLAMQGSHALSELAGWYKELSDADGGTGFSFADLAANRAGIRFAQLATRSRDEARYVRRRAAQGLTENDFMPRIDGLPEGLDKGDYVRQFGNRQDNPNYRAMIDYIDRRLGERPLYRGSP